MELSPLWNQDFRVPQSPDRYGFDQDQVNYALSVSKEDPTMYQVAIANNDRESWMVAMSELMKSLL